MKKIFVAVFAQFLLLFLTGCANVSISPNKLTSLPSVSISPSVKLADHISYTGPEQAWGVALGGVVGGLVAQRAETIPNQIKEYLKNNDINVAQITRTEFIKGLQNDPRFSGKISDNSANHFELEVYLYGLAQNGGFSSEYKVWMGIRAQLVDASGNVIWEDKDFVTPHNNSVPAAPYKAFFEDPNTFRTGFIAAADAVTQMLLNDM